jgi:hypothetical protein
LQNQGQENLKDTQKGAGNSEHRHQYKSSACGTTGKENLLKDGVTTLAFGRNNTDGSLD